MVGGFPKGLQAAAFLAYSVLQGVALAAEGMVPPGFLVAVHQHIVRRFNKQRFNLKAHQPRLVDNAGNGLGIKKLAAAHVRRDGDQRIMQIGSLAGLHKRHQHHGGQVVHTQGPQILQMANGNGFARAAHAR